MKELLRGWVGIQIVTQASNLLKDCYTGNDPHVCMKSPELISNTINVGRGEIAQVCELTLVHQERCCMGMLLSSPPEKSSEEFRKSSSSWHLLSLTGLKKGKAGSLGWFLTVTQSSMY